MLKFLVKMHILQINRCIWVEYLETGCTCIINKLTKMFVIFNAEYNDDGIVLHMGFVRTIFIFQPRDDILHSAIRALLRSEHFDITPYRAYITHSKSEYFRRTNIPANTRIC